MTPQKKGVVPDAEEQRVRAAVIGAEAAEKELRASVVAALIAGGSVREVARVSGMSTNTIERWGRAGGWPSPERQARWAEGKRVRDEMNAKFEAARRQLEGNDE